MSSVTAAAAAVPKEEAADGAGQDGGPANDVAATAAVNSNSVPPDPAALKAERASNCHGETEIKEEPMDTDQPNHKDASNDIVANGPTNGPTNGPSSTNTIKENSVVNSENAVTNNVVKENNCSQSPKAATPTSTATTSTLTTTDSEPSKPSTSAEANACSPSTSQATSSPLPPPPPPPPSDEDRLTLSTTDLEVLSELDSSAFGYVKLNEERHARKKKLALKAITYMEQVVALRNFRKRKRPGGAGGGEAAEDDLSNNNDKRTAAARNAANVRPKVYCKLGHLHLLLEDYGKALSAYRKYSLLAAEEARNDILFLYGQGIVFFHFNAYHWATRSFQQALYVQPNFARASEVHARLGIMAKINGDFASSLKYFRLAKKCYESPFETRPCILSEEGIAFHIAHLHEISGKQSTAITLYKELLSSKGESLSSSLKAEIHRQLGWTYYNAENLGDKQTRCVHISVM